MPTRRGLSSSLALSSGVCLVALTGGSALRHPAYLYQNSCASNSGIPTLVQANQLGHLSMLDVQH